jgi:hypothetical protein
VPSGDQPGQLLSCEPQPADESQLPNTTAQSSDLGHLFRLIPDSRSG